MNLSHGAIHRPIFTLMVVMIVIILGVTALLRLPIDLMPDISFPTLSISTDYSNASPQEMEELVTRVIEEAMSAVPGVQEVSSSSSEGESNVRVTFVWGTDLDAAANDVRDRLDRIMGRLPDDVDRPTLRKFDVNAFPILILGASSDMEPLEFRQFIEDQVKYRVERVPGVASLDIFGGLSREIHVDFHPDRVKALGLSLDQIVARIKAANITLPAGTIKRGNYEVTVRTPGEFVNLDDLRATVLGERNGVPIRLHEVATVDDGHTKVTRIVRVNGRPGIRLSINKQSGTNTVAVAEDALAEIARINEEMPQINIVPIVDSSEYIRRSIDNVTSSAVIGGALAVLILLIFLRDLRSTAIIAVAIPISIIATFMLMYFCGFTLNLMTLGGLALGVGMMVDNSIVVLENIFRLRDEEKMPALKAALQGSQEVGAAVISSTLTTVVVFLPLIFVRGMSGVMFKQLSIVIGFSLLCSLAVSLAIVPMLARFIKTAHPADTPANGRIPILPAETFGQRLIRWSDPFFAWMESTYKNMLHRAMDHRWVVVVAAVLLLGGSFLLVPFIGVEMMPETDEGEVRVSVEMEVGTQLDLTDATMRKIEPIVQQAVPESKRMVTTIGGGGGPGGGGSGTHAGSMNLALVSRSQRDRSSEQVANDLRRPLASIPGAIVRTRTSQGFNPFRRGMGSSDRLQVEIRGHDFATAEEVGREVRRIVSGIDGVTDTQISREAGAPEERIHIDRRKAADMRVSVQQIAAALQTCLAGTRAGTYREAGDEYNILVRLKGGERRELRDILDLTIVNAEGKPVVLRNVVSTEPQTGPTRIERKNQERLLTVSANITGRDMGSILRDVRKELRGLPLPSGFSIVFGGDYEEQQRSFQDLLLSLALSLVLVYMVMACQYESLRDPFVVMFSVPLAAIGVALILVLTRTTFNIQSFIGCIMLGGIVVNNAIILVDHANLLRRRDGFELRAAIEEAGRRRLRPILMTALTTMLGLLPLAIGLGEGGEAQAPLARTVIGGLASATLITLFVVPVVYSFFERPIPHALPSENTPQ